ITSSLTSVFEMIDGHSLRGHDLGRELTAYDYGSRTVAVAYDVASLALVVKPSLLVRPLVRAARARTESARRAAGPSRAPGAWTRWEGEPPRAYGEPCSG